MSFRKMPITQKVNRAQRALSDQWIFTLQDHNQSIAFRKATTLKAWDLSQAN